VRGGRVSAVVNVSRGGVVMSNRKSDGGSLSRREVVRGGLMAAAGALAAAAAPQMAAAVDGDTVKIGDATYADTDTGLYLTSNGQFSGVYYSSVLIHRNGLRGLPIQSVAGKIEDPAPTGSAGVWGDAYNVHHYGVQAAHEQLETALKVEGKANFLRSGVDSVAANHSSTTVTLPPTQGKLTKGSMIFVTLQNPGGAGVYLAYARRLSSTQFKVALSKAASAKTYFAWMILD
jgi:hypothetical protein